MAGFRNDVMYANNVDFSGASLPAATVTANGQLLIGSTASPNIRVNTLTAGNGVTITNGAGSITIAANGSTLPFTDEAISFAAVANNGYFCSAALTATLPASPSQGNLVVIVSDTDSAIVVQANTGQVIRVGSSASTTAGTMTSTARCDSLTLYYRASDTTWIATASMGNWTPA